MMLMGWLPGSTTGQPEPGLLPLRGKTSKSTW